MVEIFALTVVYKLKLIQYSGETRTNPAICLWLSSGGRVKVTIRASQVAYSGTCLVMILNFAALSTPASLRHVNAHDILRVQAQLLVNLVQSRADPAR